MPPSTVVCAEGPSGPWRKRCWQRSNETSATTSAGKFVSYQKVPAQQARSASQRTQNRLSGDHKAGLGFYSSPAASRPWAMSRGSNSPRQQQASHTNRIMPESDFANTVKVTYQVSCTHHICRFSRRQPCREPVPSGCESCCGKQK